MKPRHIHIADVWSVHNAGDAAILEALMAGLRVRWPEAQLSVAARFPETCTGLVGVEVLRDPLAFDEATCNAQAQDTPAAGEDWRKLAAALDNADLVVSTGGYFLNGSEGNPFEWVLRSRLVRYERVLAKGTPLALLAQSYGPFQGERLHQRVKSTLQRIPLVTARDVEGFARLFCEGVSPRVAFTADLAVTLPAAEPTAVERTMQRLGLADGMFALGVRNYPGTPTTAFADMAALADDLIVRQGQKVLLIGTTVPPAENPDICSAERALGNDDVQALECVLRSMRHPEGAVLVREALPPRLLQGVLGRCRAFISTRMHASILATCAGTPVVGIAYEPKVRGWFDQLAMPEMVLPLAQVSRASLTAAAELLLHDNAALRARLQRALPEVRGRAQENFSLLEALVAAPRALRAPSAIVADARKSWEQESHHYDTLHVRLKRIVDLAEGTRGQRLLDIGCSAGTLGAALSSRWTYHGCDISASAVASAPRGTCVAWDLEQGLPPFDGAPYDVITASGILEYIADVPKLLQAAKARLAPAGKLIVSYFNMHHRSRQTGTPFRHEHWKNNWTASEFRAMLAAAGFEICTETFSTRGLGAAPDVRQESEVLAAERHCDWTEYASDAVNHTHIWECAAVVAQGTGVEVRQSSAVSVVIPAWNRLDLLQPVLASFLEESARTPAEIVVVDDGSEPPVASLIERMGAMDKIQLMRQQANGGRGAALNTGFAAARGEIVIVVDSDIRPEPGFIAEHVQAHAQATNPKATFTGALHWGADAGLLGRLLGARANPRMEDHQGALPWTLWYTDNWSFRRAAFTADEMRFDTQYRAWGFEDLELGWRLEQSGATNRLLSTARGAHLKPVTFEGLTSCFRRSVPNLQRLAAALPAEQAVQDWEECFLNTPAAVAAAEQFLRAQWTRVQELERAHPEFEAKLPARLRRDLAVALSNALFRVGVSRGGIECGVPVPKGRDSDKLVNLAELASALLHVESVLGAEEQGWRHVRAEVQGLQRRGRLAQDFEQRFLERMSWHAQQASLVGA